MLERLAGRMRLLALGAVGAAVLLTGCHRTYSEMLIRSGITGPDAPEWAAGNPQTDGQRDRVYFVGRSVAYNVVDEAGAVAAAREDIYRQIAQLISTRVTTRSHAGDRRVNTETAFHKQPEYNWAAGFLLANDGDLNGPWPGDRSYDGDLRFLPGAELQQMVEREAWLFASCVAGDLIDEGVYFEQWDVRKMHGGLDEHARNMEEQEYGIINRASGMIRYKCWVRMSIDRERLEQRIREFRMHVNGAYERYLEDRERAIAWAQQDRELRIAREEETRHWIRQDQLEDREEARKLRHMWTVDHVRFNVATH